MALNNRDRILFGPGDEKNCKVNPRTFRFLGDFGGGVHTFSCCILIFPQFSGITFFLFHFLQLQCHLQMMHSSMRHMGSNTHSHQHGFFPGFTWLRSKYGKEMKNPLLFLSIMGSAMPRPLVEIDTDALAPEFVVDMVD